MKHEGIVTLILALLIAGLMCAPVHAQGPIDTSSATWLTDFIAAQRVNGYTAMTAQAPNANVVQHSAWLDETRYWAAVCGGDPNCGVSVWTGYMGGWSVAAFRYLPITFWGATLGTYSYGQYQQQRYAPWGYDAYGNIRN